VAMYLAKQLTARSLPEIGRKFGGRDHTTGMHAVKRIEELGGGDRAPVKGAARAATLAALRALRVRASQLAVELRVDVDPVDAL